MSDRRKVGLQVKLDGRLVESETTVTWAGPYVLAIATVLPERELLLGVHSCFLGHEDVPTLASHIVVGPRERTPYAVTAEHDHASVDPVLHPRECVYEHAGIVVEALKALSEHVGIEVPDDAFAAIERDG
ncbi:MAG TPA: hypothetical protein VK707_07220 [Solirubrobacteraceae bacterium]|nr:hypothetical protein [Solirubrobacteraceae bacterium]